MARKRPSSRRHIPKARHVRRPTLSRKDVTRGEHNRLIDIFNERNTILNGLREGQERLEHASEVQFKRIAQIQADLDEIKRARDRVKTSS